MAIEINHDLIKQWEPKIQSLLSNTFVRGLDREDLEQELRIAIIKAARGFNEDKGVLFHTYLHTSMVNTLRTLISRAQRTIVADSLDKIEMEQAENQVPKVPKSLQANLPDMESSWLDPYGFNELERQFVLLRIEGLTMEEITNTLDESAYKLRTSIQHKIREVNDALEETEEGRLLSNIPFN